MNNESNDAVRLEVKLFSGFYFEKISSASMSDVHHNSHSNHVWFVFAKVGCISKIYLNVHTVRTTSVDVFIFSRHR